MKVLRPPSFDLHLSVAIVRAGQLGALGKAHEQLAHGFRHLFEAADTRKPVRRRRRGVPANRRAVRTTQVVTRTSPVAASLSLALAKFLPPDALETLSLCNRPDAKVLYLGADASAPPLKKTWKETMAELDRAVQRFKIKIARLAEDSECN